MGTVAGNDGIGISPAWTRQAPTLRRYLPRVLDTSMGWRRLWRTVGEDMAGGSAHHALGHAAAEEPMKKTGPPARRENDQVAPEPPGDPDNLVGRISLAKDCVGHHAGLANPIANSAECSPGVLPPLIGEADQDTSSHFGDCVRGRRRKHMHEHQLCPIAGGQACRPIQPLIRQRGEIGRAQNATIFIGPALPARPYCHGGDLPRMLAGSCSASVPPPEPTRILGGRGHRQCRVHQTVPERLRHTTDSRGNATLGGIPQASAGPVREIPPSASSGP